jgi:hypothetical protein
MQAGLSPLDALARHHGVFMPMQAHQAGAAAAFWYERQADVAFFAVEAEVGVLMGGVGALARGAVRGGVLSSRSLGRALETAGNVRPDGSAAHHIVASGAQAAAPARAVLRRFDIGINDAANGVFLPATRIVPNAAGAAVHSPLHTRAYYQAVNAALRRAATREEALEVLNDLRHGLLSGGL